MRGIKRFGFILMLVSVTACAPVVYDATYRAPSGHVSVQTIYTQPSYRYQSVRQQVHPIEVTLYADNSYTGIYFRPIRVVIADGQYVEIPVRDRRGRNTKIYAHYYNKNLHFDADKHCRGIHGSPRYSYDNRWDKGHKYSNINAGKDYDLKGLRLQVRNAPGRHHIKKDIPVMVVNKPVTVNQKVKNIPAKRPVVVVPPKNKVKQVVVHKQKLHVSSAKAQALKNKSGRRAPVKVVKTQIRPTIVEKINRGSRSQHVSKQPSRPVDNSRVNVRNPVNSNSRPASNQGNRNGNTVRRVASVKKMEDAGRSEIKEKQVAAQSRNVVGSPKFTGNNRAEKAGKVDKSGKAKD